MQSPSSSPSLQLGRISWLLMYWLAGSLASQEVLLRCWPPSVGSASFQVTRARTGWKLRRRVEMTALLVVVVVVRPASQPAIQIAV